MVTRLEILQCIGELLFLYFPERIDLDKIIRRLVGSHRDPSKRPFAIRIDSNGLRPVTTGLLIENVQNVIDGNREQVEGRDILEVLITSVCLGERCGHRRMDSSGPVLRGQAVLFIGNAKIRNHWERDCMNMSVLAGL